MTIEYIENSELKIGVSLEWGGGLRYFSRKDVIRSVFADTPRPDTGITTLSLWGDPLTGSTVWPWDPVQAGDGNFNNSPILDWYNNGSEIYTKTRPLLWDPEDPTRNEEPDTVMEQWVTLNGNLAQVRYKITYTGPNRSARWSEFAPDVGINSWVQESPAVGLYDYDLNRFAGYLGDNPWSNEPISVWTPTPPTGSGVNPALLPHSEMWGAFVDTNDWGFGILNPSASYVLPWLVQGFEPYIAPVMPYNWTGGSQVVEFSVYLTLGSISEIRSRFASKAAPVFIEPPAPNATTLTGTKQSGLLVEWVSGGIPGSITQTLEGTTWALPISGLSPGSNVITVRAMDEATEVGRASVDVVYEATISCTATVPPFGFNAALTAPTATAYQRQAAVCTVPPFNLSFKLSAPAVSVPGMASAVASVPAFTLGLSLAPPVVTASLAASSATCSVPGLYLGFALVAPTVTASNQIRAPSGYRDILGNPLDLRDIFGATYTLAGIT
jgi:hypothetical protein